MSAPVPRRRWPRRVVLAALGLVALRVVLGAMLPWLIDRGVRSIGMTSEIEGVHLSLLRGRLVVEKLALRPRAPDGTVTDRVVLSLDYGQVDLAMLALLGGTWRAQRIDLDGLDVEVERGADGRTDWARWIASANTPSAAAEVDAEPAAPARAIDLASPVQITALRVQHARVHYLDRAVAPPLDAACSFSLRASQVGSATTPASLELDAHAPGLFDTIRVEGGGAGGGPYAFARLESQVDGLVLEALRGELATFGLEPDGDSLSARGLVTLAIAPADDTGAEPRALRPRLDVSSLRIEVDGVERANLDRATIEARSLVGGAVEGLGVTFSGARIDLARRADGSFAALGVRTARAASTAPVASSTPPSSAGAANPTGAVNAANAASTSNPAVAANPASNSIRPSAGIAAPAFSGTVDHIRVSDATVRFDDAGALPPTALTARIAQLDVGAIDPRDDKTSTRVVADLELPETLGRVHGDLDIDVEPERIAARGTVSGRDTTLAALAPYLARAGVASELAHGEWKGSIAVESKRATTPSGAIEGSVRLTQLTLRDGDEIAAVDELGIDGVHIGSDRTEVEHVKLDGLRGLVLRDEKGIVHALGLRTLAPAVDGSTRVVSAPTIAGPTVHTAPVALDFEHLPLVNLGEVKVDRFALRFVDAGVTPPIDVRTDGSSLEVLNLSIGGVAHVDPSHIGRIRATLHAPPLCAEMTVDGRVNSESGPLKIGCEFGVHANGVALDTLGPLLAPLGITPEIHAGAARLQIELAAESQSGNVQTQALVRDLEIVEGKRSLLQLDRARVEATIGASGARIGRIDVAVNGLDVLREEDGTLRCLGVVIGPRPADAKPILGPERPEPTLSERLAAAFDWPRLDLGEVSLSARSSLVDRTFVPDLQQEFRARAHVDRLAIGPGAASTPFTVTLEAPGMCADAKLTGEARLDPTKLRANARLDATGIDGAGFASLLPPNVRCELASGALHAAGGVSIERPDASTWNVVGELHDVALVGGGSAGSTETGARPLAALRELVFSLPDVHLADSEPFSARIERLVAEGAAIDVTRTADGVWHAFGFAVSPSNAAMVADELPTSSETTAAAATVPEIPTAVPRAVVLAKSGSARSLPRIAIDEVSITCDAIRVRDETLGVTSSAIVAKGRLDLARVADLFAEEPSAGGESGAAGGAGTATAPAALDLHLTGAIEPVAANIDVTARLRPFVRAPSAAITAVFSGVRGAALTELAPALAEKVDGTRMTDGTVRARLTASATWPRRGALDFGFGRVFSAEIALEGLELRDAPEGRAVAGVERVRAVFDRIDPATGDVRIKSLEIVKPSARVEFEADGLHALGLVFRGPEEASEAPKTAETTPDVGPAPIPGLPPDAPLVAAPAAKVADPAASRARKPVFAIDSLTIDGADFIGRDDTVTPPAVVPIDALDVEVRRFTTRAFEEALPISFHAYMSAGKVDLPRRTGTTSLFADVTGAASKLLTGAKTDVALEERPLFDEIAVQGRLTLAPDPKGWVNVDVGALELAPLRGSAARSGIDLGDGVLDQTLRLHFQGRDGLSIDSASTFSHLRVSENSDGPISRYLSLPAPLETVLFLLEDSEGSHKIPVHVHVDEAGIGGASVLRATLNAITTVIARAVASSPLRVLSGVGGALGLSSDPEPPGKDAQRFTYDAGDPALSPWQESTMRSIVERARADTDRIVVLQHTLGAGDLARADELANPSKADAEAILARLRQRKSVLLRQRDEIAAAARVDYSVDREAEARAAGSDLRSIEHELGQMEDAIDDLCELFRPDADRRREQRTRAACIAIAEERMQRIRRWLIEAGVPAARVEIRRARFEVRGELGEVVVTPKKRG